MLKWEGGDGDKRKSPWGGGGGFGKKLKFLVAEEQQKITKGGRGKKRGRKGSNP